jgi:hypothetical protein
MGATDTNRMIGWATASVAVVLLGVRVITGRSQAR